jgi:hypothetical protein
VWSGAHRSKDGRRLSGHFVKLTTSKKDGYVRFNYNEQGTYGNKTLHRVVAELFIPNPLNKREVNHINGDKTDNRADNLEWCTPSENQRHALTKGLRVLNTPGTSKKVGAFTDEGELVSVFPSVAEASRATGVSLHALYRRCEKRTPSQLDGYVWRYIE